jgi:hypothetical protein
MPRVLPAALLAIALTSPVHADFSDGNELLERCSSEQSFGSGYCAGYAAAIADAARVISGDQVCIPATATLAQVRDVVIQYLREHPEERHYAAGSLVLRSLLVAFPCR